MVTVDGRRVQNWEKSEVFALAVTSLTLKTSVTGSVVAKYER